MYVCFIKLTGSSIADKEVEVGLRRIVGMIM
jgi:hypothetical protein